MVGHKVVHLVPLAPLGTPVIFDPLGDFDVADGSGLAAETKAFVEESISRVGTVGLSSDGRPVYFDPHNRCWLPGERAS